MNLNLWLGVGLGVGMWSERRCVSVYRALWPDGAGLTEAEVAVFQEPRDEPPSLPVRVDSRHAGH